MELKISVKESLASNEISGQFRQNICVISCENVVVFTRVVFRSSSFKQSIPVYTLYAADINTLFEPHIIMESLDAILKLKFSSCGNHLLVITSSKNLFLYTKGSGLHQWTNTHTANWSEEEILYIDFFHMKNKVFISTSDINISGLYGDKFQCTPYQPSLKSIGNCSQNGFFAVTGSGLFMACSMNSNGIVEEEVKAILGPVRDYFSLATAAFDSNGNIHLAAWKYDLIKCWEINLQYEEFQTQRKSNIISNGVGESSKLAVNVVSTNFFSPQTLKTNEAQFTSLNVSYMSFSSEDDPTSIILFVELDKTSAPSTSNLTDSSHSPSHNCKEESDKSDCRYLLQRYQIQMKSRPLFQFFHSSPPSEKPAATASIKEWVCVSEWESSYPVIAVSDSPPGLLTEFSTRSICLATTEGAVSLINKDTMQQITKYTFPSARVANHSAKKSGGERQIISLATTWTNLHLVALDSNGSLYVLSLLKQSDVSCTWLSYLVVLLEYSLVSNYDWCDILMAIPSTSTLSIAEKITENFYQHPTKIVSHLQPKFLVLKNSVLRLSSNLHQKSIETRLQAQLSAILKVFHSLRPVTSDASNIEKNIFSKIHNYIESRNSLEVTDIDKSIENLIFNSNLLDFQVDPSLGRDMQVLLEFSSDLALYILLLLVQNSKYELAKESKTLQYLREILFLSRFWYKHNKFVLPQILKKTDSVDIWAQLYKLLTRLAQVVPNDPDLAFLDECITLETQVLCREIPLFISPRGVLGCLATSSPSPPQYPLQFHYEQRDPNPSMNNVNPRPLEGSLSPSQPFDLLCYHYLGTSGDHLQCTRCFAIRGNWWGSCDFSLWEQEWSNRCICSGLWAPSSPHIPSRAG